MYFKNRVLDEVLEVLGDQTNVGAEELDKLVYLEQVSLTFIVWIDTRAYILVCTMVHTHQVIKETLRLYPLGGGAFSKEAPTGCLISGYDVPKGTSLWVNHCNSCISILLFKAYCMGVSKCRTLPVYPVHTVTRKAILILPRMWFCLLYTSPSPRDATLSRMPSSA